MESSKDLVCEKGLRFNEHLGIIDVSSHKIHFKKECTENLIKLLCMDCDEKKRE
jgi:hypothetical protein